MKTLEKLVIAGEQAPLMISFQDISNIYFKSIFHLNCNDKYFHVKRDKDCIVRNKYNVLLLFSAFKDHVT